MEAGALDKRGAFLFLSNYSSVDSAYGTVLLRRVRVFEPSSSEVTNTAPFTCIELGGKAFNQEV
jgi:hypothetical protein